MRFLDALVPPRRVPAGPARSTGWDAAVLANKILFGGQQYDGLPVKTTWGKNPAEAIADDFAGYVMGCLRANPIVAAVEAVRVNVFAQGRFQFQDLSGGRPGRLFGDRSLSLLERPWPGGTTGQLLARYLLHADFGGNGYAARVGDDEVVLLRPDWTDIVMSKRMAPVGSGGAERHVGWRKEGFFFFEGGDRKSEPAVFLADEVAHFAPLPDPLATFRGMSWLTPIIREVQTDGQAARHKEKFFENAATPNLAVSLPKEISTENFEKFVDLMDEKHKGADNAYKTLYTGGGADVTVLGRDMQQMDMRAIQGAGETRIANAAGIHPVVAGLSEGLQGSSLNAGNYAAAKRSTVDRTLWYLWQEASAAFQAIVPPPGVSRLWVDARDIPFLRDDETDRAEIAYKESQTIRNLLDAGYNADSVQAAVAAQDWSLLKHSGLYSVQLQKPGAGAPAA